MTHSQLVDIAHRWVLRKSGCGAAFKEMRTEATTEIPDVMGFGAWGYSVMVECKISRSDFLRDKRKQHKTRMGKYRFYCAPEDMINIFELPDGYGLIEVNEKGKVCCIHNPFNRYIGAPPCMSVDNRHNGHETCSRVERNFLYSVVRRMDALI